MKIRRTAGVSRATLHTLAVANHPSKVTNLRLPPVNWAIGCTHRDAHSFDKVKCKNCGVLFSLANLRGKNICRIHPGIGIDSIIFERR